MAAKRNTSTKQTTRNGSGTAKSGSASGTRNTGRTSTKKSGGTGKRTGSAKGKTAGQSREELEDFRDYQVSYMISVLMLTLVLCVIVYMTYFGFGKEVGLVVSGILFGVFGWFAWILPVFIFFSVAVYLANGGSFKAVTKILCVFGFFLFMAAFIQIFTHGKVIMDYYRQSRNVMTHNSSGNYNPLMETFRLVRDEGRWGCGVIAYGIISALSFVVGNTISGLLLLFFSLLCFWELFGHHVMGSIRKRNAYYQQMQDLYEEESRKEDYIEPDYLVHPKQIRNAKNYSRQMKEEDKQGKVMSFDLKKMENTPDEPVTSKKKKRKSKKPDKNIVTDMEEILPEEKGKQEIFYEEILPENQDVLPQPSPSVSEDLLMEKFGGERENEEDQIQISGIGFKEEQTADESRELKPELTKETPAVSEVQQEKIQEKPEKKPVPAGNGSRSFTSSEDIADLLKKENQEKVAAKEKEKKEKSENYVYPPLNLLKKGQGGDTTSDRSQLLETATKLRTTLESFGVKVRMGNVTCGPTVTRFELLPEQGVKVSRITGLADDIKLSLAASSIRIEAPIPGKSAVGIEVPNAKKSPVFFRDLIDNKTFKSFNSSVAFAVGKDIAGKNIITDIAKMPHLLIAGATGSGKSVCINTLIMSILYKAHPDDVKLIMIDPKVVELSVYNGIPHLFIPVVTDPKKAAAALNWAVMEMMERYNKFAEQGVRNISGYNEKFKNHPEQMGEGAAKMPQIIIIVDELADLMMVASKEVEDAICRLAQLARAAGIHLVIATQRPTVNVITGTIKANIPSRIAFSVSSGTDSRTILDAGGAEKLLGQGDMLFFPAGYTEPVRLQGAFVSDDEVNGVVEFLKRQNETPVYNEAITNHVDTVSAASGNDSIDDEDNGLAGKDEYFADAGRFIIESDKASVGMLQRKFSVGFNRAARIMDQLSEAGVVGPAVGTKPRQILLTGEEFETLLQNL